MDGALVGAGLLWPRLTDGKQQFHFGAYTDRPLSDFQDGNRNFLFFLKELDPELDFLKTICVKLEPEPEPF